MRSNGESATWTAGHLGRFLRRSLPWIGGVALVVALDAFERSAVMNADRIGVARVIDFVLGSVIETLGHIVTVVLCLAVLAAFGVRAPARFAVGAVLGAMLIDLDHIPEWLGWSARTAESVRPVFHSVFTVVVIALAVVWLPARWRTFGLGVVFGTLTHLARDIAMGGIPLFWPLTDVAAAVPYGVYVGLMLGFAVAIGGGLAWRDRSCDDAVGDFLGSDRRTAC